MKHVTILVLVLLVGFLCMTPSFAQSAQAGVQAPGAAAGGVESAASADAKGTAAQKTTGNGLVIADFDTGDKPNNIGGDFGSWDKDPNDETQGCKMSFESDDALGNASGFSIRLDYDVDSANPAYNGFWMKLNNFDATQYNTVAFALKGDATKNFTKRLKIELKDASGTSPYIVTGITDKWQEFSIPFEKFKRVKNFAALTEFVVVFDDINSNPKSGSLLIDQIKFTRE